MNFLSALLWQLPYFAVLVAMAAISFDRLRLHRQVSTLVLVVVAIEIFAMLLSAWVSVELLPLLTSRGYKVTDAAQIFSVFAFASSLLRALALALLAWAVFGWRRPAVAPGHHPYPYPSPPPATPPKPTT